MDKHILFILTTLVSCYLVKAQEYRNNTTCFRTVKHYYSNPEVTGSSKLYYTFRNDEFISTTVYLSCHGKGGTSIKVERVYLLLPTTEEEYCLDSLDSDNTNCTSESQCDCCMKGNVCNVTSSKTYDQCNGKENCELEVWSQFLEDCEGREYDCAHQKCHSRWTEVVYTCRKDWRLYHFGLLVASGVSVLALLIILTVLCCSLWMKKFMTGSRPSENSGQPETKNMIA